ncbi:MAG: CocE/NonD family hydrolase [Pararhodobacter sp.]
MKAGWKAGIVLALSVLALGAAGAAGRDRASAFYREASLRLDLLRSGVTVRRDVMIPMPDGVSLATDVYLPRRGGQGLPSLLIRLPYGKGRYHEALGWARRYAPAGYAVVVQDMRGRHGSGGVFAPYAHGREDGAATLDWIAAQPWSNGRIGTAGCSALGEIQAMQAATRNPHLSALVAQAGGGAIGRGGASRSYFGMFEGGIPHLAPAVGWFATQGGKTPEALPYGASLTESVLEQLPSGSIVSGLRNSPTDYDSFIARFEDDAYWDELGYLTPDDRFAAPALHINTWHDVAIRGTFEIAGLMRRNATTEAARANQPVIVGPGLHCDPDAAFRDGGVGDLAVDPARALDLAALQRVWLDHWLRDGPAPDLAAYTYYVLGADLWQSADSWPPAGVVDRPWHLSDAGVLSEQPSTTGQAQYRYDPASPTPSLGGSICCTGDAALRAGPLDQSPNADREDVLVYTSEPMATALRIIGDARAEIAFSSDRPDTDLIATLVDVTPGGSMLTITQGALRLRYREGFDRPRLMAPGQLVDARITFAPIAYELAAGHRIGLHLASSSFPRLERNLNGSGPNHLETTPHVALNTVHHGGDAGSVLMLPVMAP